MIVVIYSARAQDGPQDRERNEATAQHVAWPNFAWLLLSCDRCYLEKFFRGVGKGQRMGQLYSARR